MIVTTLVLLGAGLYAAIRAAEDFLNPATNSGVSGDTAVVASAPASSSLQKHEDEAAEDEEPSPEEYERVVDLHLGLGTGALALATLGGLLFPPLGVASGAVSLYASYPIFGLAYEAIFKERRLRGTIIDSLAVISTVLAGYYFISSLSIVVYFAGRKLLIKTEDRSRQKLISIFGEERRMAWVVNDGVEIEVPLAQVRAGDIVVVSAGQVVPVDGKVRSGVALIDQQKLTGESQPVDRGPGEPVLAATLVIRGRVYVEVEKAGAETTAAKIGEILNQTADYRAEMEASGERISDLSVLPLLLLSGGALSAVGLEGGLAVLASNFGDNMRVVVPLSMLNTMTKATEGGLLIKDGRVLEVLSDIDTVVFDKTGTLTTEQPEVASVIPCGELGADELLALAATAESRQTHPIARAILKEATRRGLALMELEDATYQVGRGIEARVSGRRVLIGSARLLEIEGCELPAAQQQQQAMAHERGSSFIFVVVNGALSGAIELRPSLRPEIDEVLSALRGRGLSLCIISGDQEAPTRYLAEQLGIERYFAEVLPGDKAALVKKLQEDGHKVCFVGDGINDAVALKTANASVSLSGAASVATDTAQTVLMDGTLRKLPQLFKLAEKMNANTRGSLYITVGSTVFCVGGVFLLHFGLFAAINLYCISLVGSAANSMRLAFNESLKEPRDEAA